MSLYKVYSHLNEADVVIYTVEAVSADDAMIIVSLLPEKPNPFRVEKVADETPAPNNIIHINFKTRKRVA